MKIELLNVRITIQKAVVLSDQYGNRRNDYETFYRCYATVSAEAGKEETSAGLVVDDRRSLAGCSVKVDGAFHEYVLDLSANPDWKGKVDELWFEACSVKHARVAIDWMRFE